jgi:hypothetical protein
MGLTTRGDRRSDADMSGSGGGSSRTYINVGSGGSSSPSVCGSLDIETILNSPVAAVVEGLKRDDVLDVSISKSPTGVVTLVATDKQGRIAGSLTPPTLITIINCIESGFKFVAVVLGDLKGGVIRVRIRGK